MSAEKPPAGPLSGHDGEAATDIQADNQPPPREVPAGKLLAYVLPGAGEEAKRLIRPCQPQRIWMNQTPNRYAYRCVPLSAANSMGWELLSPVACEFRWNGLTPHQQVFVYREREHRFAPNSHFGSGVVTWELPFLFRTSADYGLVVAGPANNPKPHISPLEGFIRTDWLPFPFTMNWRLTSTDHTVRFEAGEPIARIYPYPLRVIDDTELELHDLDEDPGFKSRFEAWAEVRQQNYGERHKIQTAMDQSGEEPDRRNLWNRRYAHGSGSDQTTKHEHQSVFRPRPVKDRRNRG